MSAGRVQIKGIGPVQAKLAAMAAIVPVAAEAALRIEAEVIRTESMRKTPAAFDGGTLRASHVVESEQTASGPQATIGVGSGAEAYAQAVHEHPSVHSPPSWEGQATLNWNVAGTGPKFLENATTEALPGMQRRIGVKMAAALKTGGL